MHNLVPLSATDGAFEVGGKGAGLARLISARLPVPPVWRLPAQVLDDYLVESKLLELAELLEAQVGRGDWVPLANQLRWAILREPLPPRVQGDLTELFASFTNAGLSPTLAIRSSATCESLPGASFAGLFQTFLDVQDVEQASAAIRSCWASLYSVQAINYRLAQANMPAPGMAVLLQRFVPGQCAGTAIVSEAGIEVESAWGLGASLMSGLVVPDRFSFDGDGLLLRVSPGHKAVRAHAAGGNLAWDRVASGERSTASLDENSANRVAELAVRAAGALGMPLELEWVLEDEQVWLVQARYTEGSFVPAGSPRPDGKNMLHGIPASPGQATGPVRLVANAEDFDTVDPAEIVVSRYAAAAMAANFRGGGWVTEMGGASGHGVSIARERRLPMVTGVLGATHRLKQGELVCVDGLRGTVERLPAGRPRSFDA